MKMVDFHDLNYELGLILFQLILSCFFAYTICVSKDYFQFGVEAAKSAYGPILWRWAMFIDTSTNHIQLLQDSHASNIPASIS